MEPDWAVHGYKARLDAAIMAERWDEVEQIRIAAKRRLMELTVGGDAHAVEQARDALIDSFETLQLSKRIRIGNDAVSMATKLSADTETAGIAVDVVPLPLQLARSVKESILQHLSRGNRRPMTSGELARHTGNRPETIARALAQLRAEGRVVSRRMGRNVLHRIPSSSSHTNYAGTLEAADNRSARDGRAGVQNGEAAFGRGSFGIDPAADVTSASRIVKQRVAQARIGKWNPSSPVVLTPEDVLGAKLPPADAKLTVRINRSQTGIHVNDPPTDAQIVLSNEKLKV